MWSQDETPSQCWNTILLKVPPFRKPLCYPVGCGCCLVITWRITHWPLMTVVEFSSDVCPGCASNTVITLVGSASVSKYCNQTSWPSRVCSPPSSSRTTNRGGPQSILGCPDKIQCQQTSQMSTKRGEPACCKDSGRCRQPTLPEPVSARKHVADDFAN